MGMIPSTQDATHPMERTSRVAGVLPTTLSIDQVNGHPATLLKQ